MAFCALCLAQGSTTISTISKFTTTKHYLKVESSIFLRHKMLDPLLYTCDLEAQFIKEVLSEVKRWESVPNHRKTATVKMVMHAHKKCKNKYSESVESIPCDWIVLDIFYGFRLYE